MRFLLSIAIVMGAVLGGFAMHGGDMKVLWQPNEVLIILGSGVGATLLSNPLSVVKHSLKSMRNLFRARPKSKKDYLELLSFLFNVFKLMKVKGMLEIESHIENPDESDIFNQAPSIIADHNAKDFIRDYLRILTMGVDDPHQFENLLEQEIGVYEHEEGAPARVMQGLGDALPALGIVAAVLGVITTMRSISEPPEVLGALIGAALVGTFMGVLLSYALFGPIGNYLGIFAEAQVKYYECIKVGLIAYLNGHPPVVIVEFVRKNIPEDLRPTFQEADELLNNKTKE